MTAPGPIAAEIQCDGMSAGGESGRRIPGASVRAAPACLEAK